MSYPYSTPISFYQADSTSYSENSKKPSVLPAAVGGFILGTAAGGGLSALKNPYFQEGNIATDTFTKKACKKYIKKGATDAEKTQFEQIEKVLKEIKKVKDKSGLDTLLNNNTEAKKAISNNILNGVTNETLNGNKKTIIQILQAKQKEYYQPIQNNITECWDKAAKKFIKPDSISEDKFNAVKKAAQSVKACHIAKFAAIGGIIASLSAVIVKKVIDNKNAAKQ